MAFYEKAYSFTKAHQLPAQVFPELSSLNGRGRTCINRGWRRISWCCKEQSLCSKEHMLNFLTGVNLSFLSISKMIIKRISKVFSYLISGKPQISGSKTLLPQNAVEFFSRFLPKGHISSTFLCYCEVFLLFKSTSVGNCVLGTASLVQF